MRKTYHEEAGTDSDNKQQTGRQYGEQHSESW